MSDFNQQVIDEFRANGGKVPSMFGDTPMVILHTIGARSGEPRQTPLVTQLDGDRKYVFASAAGSPKHPAWFHNVTADPEIVIEYGDEKIDVAATVVTGADRDAVYARQVEAMPQFGEYVEQAGSRVIPVIALDPR